MMRFRVPVALFVAAVALVTSVWFNPASTTLSAADSNAYFDALVTRAGFWKGYSFRPKPGYGPDSPYFSKQLEYRKEGGYQASNSAPKYVTYDEQMDAAKVVIPMWVQPGWSMVLGSAMGPGDTKFYPNSWSGGTFSAVNRQFKIDGEIMIQTGVDPDGTNPRGVRVSRGQGGTKAAAHAAGAAIYGANNSLPHQVRVPLDTVDGNTYIFTWDALFSSSYLGTGLDGNKTFQFSSGADTIWWEVKTRMDGGSKISMPPGFNRAVHVAGLDVRSYNAPGGLANWLLTDGDKLGPGVTQAEPVAPMESTFLIYANRWVRYWVVVDQRENDYDYIDLYAADEQTEPRLIYKHIPASVYTKEGNSIKKFWLEFNDSEARLTPERMASGKDMVAYVRNFAALRNVSDVRPLLQRPVPGVVPGETSTAPGAPKNVRIVRY